MRNLQEYIIQEWAEEYRQGRLNRREFIRRTILMAGSTALAIPVLNSLGIAAGADETEAAASSTPPAVAAGSGATVPADDPAIEGGMVSFPMGTVTVQAYLARPRTGGQAPGVLVIHENRGLLEHYKDVARRLTKVGYAALAVDLVSPSGGTARFSDSAEISATLGRTPPDQLVEMMNAAVRHLQSLPTVRRDRIGTMGFCFGGGMVWRLATRNADLRAAAPFYGSNPPLEDVPKMKAAVLAIYGERDTRINAGIPAVREAMQRAGIMHEIVIYPGADHAFFNDTSPRYHEAAATAAWQRTLAWFGRHLKQ